MLLLLACAASQPGMPVPTVLAPAEHAEAVSVDAFLAPTALGASNDLLCPWARGEPVPDASLARWIAEKRLTWRVLEIGATSTFAGSAAPDAAQASMDAASALASRCGTEPTLEVLVAAAPDATLLTVARAMVAVVRIGFEPGWLLVDDPTPGPPPPDTAPPVQIDVRVGSDGRVVVEREEVVAGTQTAADPGVTPGTAAPVVAAPPVDTSLAVAVAGPAACAVVTAADGARWERVVAAIDGMRARGVPNVFLATESSVEAGIDGGVPALARRLVPLHGTVAAIPLSLPRDVWAEPCGHRETAVLYSKGLEGVGK
ncbi:MAG: hypothetical protein Q8P41_15245 [Pseudomonadota bacterium]|nr:hypothetical protein [Pseudomonadota bacterium]